MKVHVHGIQELDFEPKDGGKIKGTNLFFSFAEDGVIGERTDKIFLKDGFTLPPVKPNDIIDIDYNNRGKPVNITIVKS